MTRSVIVTGGFGVLGRAVSAAFAAAGDRVARIDFAPAVQEDDGYLDIGGVDLTDPAAAQAAAAGVADAFGQIDILVNVAGGFTWNRLADGGIENWDRMYAMNLRTCVNMIEAALPELLKQPSARIVNIGSMSALAAGSGMGGYAASKSAVHRLTESLSIELGDNDITVNAVLPAIIDTPANRADMPDADFSTWVRPAAIADTILFLASHAARGVNGALVPVSRGHD